MSLMLFNTIDTKGKVIMALLLTLMMVSMMLWMLEAVFGSCFKCASKRAAADIKIHPVLRLNTDTTAH